MSWKFDKLARRLAEQCYSTYCVALDISELVTSQCLTQGSKLIACNTLKSLDYGTSLLNQILPCQSLKLR